MWRCGSLQQLLLGLDGLSAENDFSAHALHEPGQTIEFALDLVGKFTDVAENEGRTGLGLILQALKDG